MEATVTMPLTQYEDLRSEIREEMEVRSCLTKIVEEQNNALIEKETLILKLMEKFMKPQLYISEFVKYDLDYLLKKRTYDESINGFYTAGDAFKELGITLEIQRDYVTQRYNEYQAEKQQEEAANEQASTSQTE